MTDILDRARTVLNDITALDGDCKLIDVAFIHELVAEVEAARLQRTVLVDALHSLLSICDDELDPNKTPEMATARTALARAKTC